MVIVNNNVSTTAINISRYAESIKDITIGTDIITGTAYDLTSDFSLPAQTALILKLK